MSLPAWVERYKESVALSPDDFKLAEALAIAVEALKDIEFLTNDAYWAKGSIDEAAKLAKDALRRIEEMK